jgi:hypothetical protein
MRVINKQQALEKVVQNLGLNEFTLTSSLKNQMIAEYLRHAIYSLSHTSTTVQPVFVTKLINQVKRQLMPLWPELVENTGSDNPIERVLRYLEQIREVAPLGNGYWLPTPVRLVRLPNTKILLIGGIDTKSLQAHFGNIVHSTTGLVRWIKSTDDTMNLVQAGVEWQRFEDWVGESETDIRTWTHNLLDKARQLLKPSGSEITDFEVYIPSSPKNAPQHFRWRAAPQLTSAPKRLVLCRFRQAFVSYYLGKLTGEKKVRLLSEIGVEQLGQEVEISKLLYGLDALYQCPTYAQFEQPNEKHGKLKFSSRLPTTQLRLLLALAHQISNYNKFPLIYEFSNHFKTDIFEHLKKLGIHIKES